MKYLHLFSEDLPQVNYAQEQVNPINKGHGYNSKSGKTGVQKP